MARTDREVIRILRQIYESEFGGKKDQRYNITWANLRELKQFSRLEEGAFYRLFEEGVKHGLYLLDLGLVSGEHIISVIRTNTVNRWRRVPKKILDAYRPPVAEARGKGPPPRPKAQPPRSSARLPFLKPGATTRMRPPQWSG